MSTRRTAWHYFLGLLLAEKAPRCFEVLAEVPVTLAIQHMDWLFLRRLPWKGPPDRGETLVELWPELPHLTLGEYKSASRAYRRGELHRLLGYAHQYLSERADEVEPGELAVALLVGVRNEALDDDLRRLGARERPLGGGYVRVEGFAFAMLLIDLNEVAASDRADYIALFADRAPVPPDARSWWYARYGTRTETSMNASEMEEFEALERRFIESLTIEKRLAGLEPEQRLAGLSEAEAVLAMPDVVLAGLTDAFVDALPTEVRERVRSRRAAYAALRPTGRSR